MNVQDSLQVEAAVSAGDIPAAIQVLQNYTDLRATDLPPLGKPALKALAANPAAVRQLVLTCVHPSLSVRRFARKYVPKAGAHAAAPMLFLAAECMRPVGRPDETLLGESFDGYSNPVGAHIARQKLSFDPPAPPANYSKADRFARDIMDNLLFLLASTSPEYFVLFTEYCESLEANSRYGDREEVKRPWPHGDYVLATVANWDGAALLEKSSAFPTAAQKWLQFRFLLDEPQSDQAAAALRARYQKLPEVNRQTARESLRVWVARHLHGYKPEVRTLLLPLIAARTTSHNKRDDTFFARYLEDWVKRNPGELEKARQAGTPADESYLPPPVDLEKVGRERAGVAQSLLALAEALRLKEPAKQARSIVASASRWGNDDDDDDEDDEDDADSPFHFRPAPQPGDAELLARVATSVGTGKGIVPEDAWREAPWQADMLQLLQRLAAPHVPELRAHVTPGWEWHPHQPHPANAAYYALRELTDWALTFLNEPGLNSWAALLASAFEALGGANYEIAHLATQTLQARAMQPTELLHLIAQPRHSAALGDQSFQSAVAQLYAKPEPRAQQFARDAVTKIPFPNGSEYYKRSTCNDPWRWVCWAAWKRQDAEMLANLLQFCTLSYHTKGKPTIPEAPPNFTADNYAPTTSEAKGVPLEEVWTLLRVHVPQRLPAILQSLLPLAEIEELPRVLLRVVAAAAPDDLDAVQAQLLALLESSQPLVAASALEALRRRPALALSKEDWVLETLRRCLQSPSSGLAKEAAGTLGTLGIAWHGHGDAAHSLLVEALELDTATVLEQVLRSLKEVRSGASVAALDGPARTRIQELASKDAKRFERLAKQLLQN